MAYHKSKKTCELLPAGTIIFQLGLAAELSGVGYVYGCSCEHGPYVHNKHAIYLSFLSDSRFSMGVTNVLWYHHEVIFVLNNGRSGRSDWCVVLPEPQCK